MSDVQKQELRVQAQYNEYLHKRVQKSNSSIRLDESIGLTYLDHNRSQTIDESLPETIYLSQSVAAQEAENLDDSLTLVGRSEFSTPSDKFSYLLKHEIDIYEKLIAGECKKTFKDDDNQIWINQLLK